jgi:hypothetical protein
LTTTPSARLAALGDAPSIAKIYNQGIEDRTLFSNVSNARMARSAPLASGDARVIVERQLGAAARD